MTTQLASTMKTASVVDAMLHSLPKTLPCAIEPIRAWATHVVACLESPSRRAQR